MLIYRELMIKLQPPEALITGLYPRPTHAHIRRFVPCYDSMTYPWISAISAY